MIKRCRIKIKVLELETQIALPNPQPASSNPALEDEINYGLEQWSYKKNINKIIKKIKN